MFKLKLIKIYGKHEISKYIGLKFRNSVSQIFRVISYDETTGKYTIMGLSGIIQELKKDIVEYAFENNIWKIIRNIN